MSGGVPNTGTSDIGWGEGRGVEYTLPRSQDSHRSVCPPAVRITLTTMQLTITLTMFFLVTTTCSFEKELLEVKLQTCDWYSCLVH